MRSWTTTRKPARAGGVSTSSKVITSYSELDTFRQCPLKHQLAWRQRWYKEPDEKRQRGTDWHGVMQAHYRALQQHQTSRRQQVAEMKSALTKARQAVEPLFYDHDTGEQSEGQALLEWMYNGYVAMWRNDPEWWVDDIERTMVVPLPAVTPGIGKVMSKRYFLKVRIDLIVRNPRGQRLVVDHKSSQYLKSKFEFDIDDQFGLYVWACRQAGLPAFAAVHNNARTHRNQGDKNGTKPQLLSERFRREVTFRSETELWNLALDAARAAQAMTKGRTDAVFSSPNPDMCKWKCDFVDAHLEMRRGIAPNVAMKDYGFTRRLRNG